MKFLLFFLLLIIASFLSYSYVIIPEYKFRISVALILDLLFLFVFLFLFFKNEISKILFYVRSRRFKYLLRVFIFLIPVVMIIFFVIEAKTIKRIDLTFGKRSSYTLSKASIDFLSSVKGKIEFDFIKSKNSNEQRLRLFALEFDKYLSNFSFNFINPNIDSVKYDSLKKRINGPLNAGDLLVVSDTGIIVTNDITEKGLLNAVFLSINGPKEICVLNKFPLDLLNNYGDKGLLSLSKELSRAGFIIKMVNYSEIKKCENLSIINPVEDLTALELKEIKSFKGFLFFAGGLNFTNIKNIVSDLGFAVSDEPVSNISNKALSGSSSSIVTLNWGDYKNVLLESPYSISCNECKHLAFVDDDKLVLSQRGKIIVLSSFSGNNYFMRFRSNQLMFKNLFYKISGFSDFRIADKNTDSNLFFFISPSYLNLFFVLFLFIIPLFTFVVGFCVILEDN